MHTFSACRTVERRCVMSVASQHSPAYVENERTYNRHSSSTITGAGNCIDALEPVDVGTTLLDRQVRLTAPAAPAHPKPTMPRPGEVNRSCSRASMRVRSLHAATAIVTINACYRENRQPTSPPESALRP